MGILLSRNLFIYKVYQKKFWKYLSETVFGGQCVELYVIISGVFWLRSVLIGLVLDDLYIGDGGSFRGGLNSEIWIWVLAFKGGEKRVDFFIWVLSLDNYRFGFKGCMFFYLSFIVMEVKRERDERKKYRDGRKREEYGGVRKRIEMG